MGAGSALIVGGGIAGLSAAIALCRIGWAVDLVERDPGWRVHGAGVTLTGPTLRAFERLGVFPAIEAQGYVGDGIDVCAMDGAFLSRIPTPAPVGAGTPGSGGVLRPTLHKILSDRVLAAGVRVRLGVTADRLEPRARGVRASFSDGEAAIYDLVLGADGVFSQVRARVFPEAPPPVYTGQVCWRVTAPRPAEVPRRRYFLGGPVKVGLSPVSAGQMYMFLLETAPAGARRGDDLHLRLAELLHGFGGPLAEIRGSLGPGTDIVPRPLLSLLPPPPWFRGRVLLVGDAAHATTPQLASGAGLAVEDALVLAEELDAASDIDEALRRYMARRYDRCRLVVENSVEIGRREQAGAPPAAQAELVERSLAALAEPV